MRCFYPRDVYVPSTGKTYNVPCGKCPACRKRSQSQWVLRMDLERVYGGWKNSFFCTLTYESNYLPRYVSIDYDSGEVVSEPVLSSSDVSAFFKRYRRYSGDNCKYFACGEYGDKFNRPHIHFVIYTNLDYMTCLSYIKRAWSRSVSKDVPLGSGVFSVDGTYHTKRQLFGIVTLSAVNIRRMRYVAKYIVKDSNSNSLVPKFARVSKGLGKCFLDHPDLYAIMKLNLNAVYHTTDGKPVSLPRYYKNRIFTASELETIQDHIIRSLKECPADWPYEKRVSYYENLWLHDEMEKSKIMLSRFKLF